MPSPVSGEIESQELNDWFSYLESLLLQANGGPIDEVTSVAQLNSKYPNGANGIVLVNGIIYLWNGTQWITNGTIYQAAGIADGSVTRQKTAFYEALFTNIKGEMTDGRYYPAGDVVVDATKATTGIINCTAGQKFKIRNTGLGASNNQGYVFYWRSDLSKLSGVLADGEFIVPAGGARLRVGVHSNARNTFVLMDGDDEFGYADPEHVIVDSDQFKNNIVKPEATTYIKKEVNNLFDFKTFISDYYYYLNGEITTTNGLGSFEFPVVPGQSYEMQWVGFANDAIGNTYITFWSESEFIESIQGRNFTVPSNQAIKICRIAVKPNPEHIPEIVLVDKREKYMDTMTNIDASNIDNLPTADILLSCAGDSIMTFDGAMRAGNRPYYPNNNVDHFDKTFLGQLVNNRHRLKLLVNNSWSGSWVSTNQGNGQPTSSGTMACQHLSYQGKDPDIILLTKGTNDYGGNVLLTDFETQYRLMVANTKLRYPNAKIYVCTLLYRTVLPVNNNGDTVQDFNDVIKTIALDNNLDIIDFYNCGIDETNASQCLIDGLHPNAAGHKLMFEYAKTKIYEYAA